MAIETKKAPVVVSPKMARLIKELAKLKPSIESLDPEERDKKVLELRNRLLSERETRKFTAVLLNGTPEFVKLQEKLLERQKQLEPYLKSLSYSDRCAELDSLKKRMMEE